MWLDRLPDILRSLRNEPRSGLWRKDIEQLFGLGKEAALQIMRAAATKITYKNTKAAAIVSSEVLSLLEQIPPRPMNATPAQHRKWAAEANAVFAALISVPGKRSGGAGRNASANTGYTQVSIPADLAVGARQAADFDGISLDQWVAGIIAREVKKRARPKHDPAPQEEPTLFRDDSDLPDIHAKPS